MKTFYLKNYLLTTFTLSLLTSSAQSIDADVFNREMYKQKKVLSTLSENATDEQKNEALINNLREQKKKLLEDNSIEKIKKKIVRWKNEETSSRNKKFWEDVSQAADSATVAVGTIAGIGTAIGVGSGALVGGPVGAALATLVVGIKHLFFNSEVRNNQSIREKIITLENEIDDLYFNLEHEPIRDLEEIYVKQRRYKKNKNLRTSIETNLIDARRGVHNLLKARKSIELALELPTCSKRLLDPGNIEEDIDERLKKFNENKHFNQLEKDLKKSIEHMVMQIAIDSITPQNSSIPLRKTWCFVGSPSTGKSTTAKKILEFLELPYYEMTPRSSHDFSMENMEGRDPLFQNAKVGLITKPLITKSKFNEKKSYNNAFLIINDLDKILADAKSQPSTHVALLDFLDPGKSTFFNEFFGADIDISRLNVIITLNNEIGKNDNYEGLRSRIFKQIKFPKFNLLEDDWLLMGQSPPQNVLKKIKSGEVGVFCIGENLFLKNHGKEIFQVERRSDVNPHCLDPETFDILKRMNKSIGCNPNLTPGKLSSSKKSSSLDEVKRESLNAVKGEIGPRAIPGWKLKDVKDLGNCFYDAVAHQMKLMGHPFLNEVPEATKPRDSLRLRIQGEDFKDEEWAEHEDFLTFATKFSDLILAIIDTRNPEAGYTYHYLDTEGNLKTHVPDDPTPLPNNKETIKLAATGNHFLSVVSEASENLNPVEIDSSHDEKENPVPLKAVGKQRLTNEYLSNFLPSTINTEKKNPKIESISELDTIRLMQYVSLFPGASREKKILNNLLKELHYKHHVSKLFSFFYKSPTNIIVEYNKDFIQFYGLSDVARPVFKLFSNQLLDDNTFIYETTINKKEEKNITIRELKSKLDDTMNIFHIKLIKKGNKWLQAADRPDISKGDKLALYKAAALVGNSKAYLKLAQALEVTHQNLAKVWYERWLIQVLNLRESGNADINDQQLLNHLFANSTRNGDTPFHLAIRQGKKEVLSVLLQLYPNEINKENTIDKNIPLMLATSLEHEDLVQLLLQQGANKDQAHPETGNTPLMLAASSGNYDIAKLLKDHNADITKTNELGLKAWQIADRKSLPHGNKKEGFNQIVDLLRPREFGFLSQFLNPRASTLKLAVDGKLEKNNWKWAFCGTQQYLNAHSYLYELKLIPLEGNQCRIETLDGNGYLAMDREIKDHYKKWAFFGTKLYLENHSYSYTFKLIENPLDGTFQIQNVADNRFLGFNTSADQTTWAFFGKPGYFVDNGNRYSRDFIADGQGKICGVFYRY